MMNSLINDVWSLATTFVRTGELVTINAEAVDKVVVDIVKQKLNQDVPATNWPRCINPEDNQAMQELFLYELIANSVNYCYWYGRYNIRPKGANSVKMYKLLDESFGYLNQLKEHATFDYQQEKETVIRTFIEKLSEARFPLIDHRVRHLNEILNRSDLLSVIDISVHREDYSVDEWLNYLITSFPGYSKDLFLKRAFLFIMQMYRRCGIFGSEINKVLVPADYQIPRVLRELGCIEYDGLLAGIVDSDMLIAEGSQEECEIRAATIVVCERIADRANCSCEAVDTYLWSRRKEATKPFHLTITTSY